MRAGRLSYGLTRINTPGGCGRPRGRGRCFSWTGVLTARAPTQIWDFKRAERNHMREPAGDGIRQNKKVDVKGVPAARRAGSPSARTCSGAHVCGLRATGEMEISVLSKQRVCHLPQLARGRCHGHRWCVTTYSPPPSQTCSSFSFATSIYMHH